MEYEIVDRSVQVDDLNILNDALLTAIYKYGRLINVGSEMKILFDLYRSTNAFRANKDLKHFQNDRRIIGMKVYFIINRSKVIAKLYEKYIKSAIKYAKMLKNLESPDSEKNPIKWIDLAIEDRAELIKLIHDRLITCTNLIEHCNHYQQLALHALIPMIDIFKETKDISNMKNFVEKMHGILKNQAVNITERYIRDNLNILSEEIVNRNSYLHEKVIKFNSEKESFKTDIRKWKEKVYQRQVIDDSDSSTESIVEPQFDNVLVRNFAFKL